MAAPSPVPVRNPRDIITPDALQVSPELLGLPLARPWRRAAAMTIDGVLVAILTNAPSIIFGVAAALVLFRISARPATDSGYVRRSVRWMLRAGGAVALFGTVVSLWGSASERLERTTLQALGGTGVEVVDARTDSAARAREFTGHAGLAVAADLLGFRQARDLATARVHAESIALIMSEKGAEPSAVREILTGVAESAPDRPWLREAIDSTLVEMEARAKEEDAVAIENADSLALAYATALSANDSARAAELRPALLNALGRERFAELDEDLGELREDRRQLRARVDGLEERLEEGGVLPMLRGLADDLGLGFGWLGLYFTSSLALWRGRTPGKRLLGIRVIRLNGKPIGWWHAFERFGGYAAGIATGLLGFLQIFWDRNRQAIHDKISETAVIRDRADLPTNRRSRAGAGEDE